ncbi:MAG: ORF6N domain-containing protein [Sphingobacteriales bacterium]
MFSLTAKEWANLRSQFVTSSWGGTRYAPKAFTEQG